MENINIIELKDESVYPDENVLKNILGKSYNAYLKLLNLYDEYGMDYTWRYYKYGKAWLCKVQKKKRTIVDVLKTADVEKASLFGYFISDNYSSISDIDV